MKWFCFWVRVTGLIAVSSFANISLASESVFKELDNNIYVNFGYGQVPHYNYGIYGLEATIYAKHMWYNLNVNGWSSLQYSGFQPYWVTSGTNLGAKVGFGIQPGSNWNLVPFVGYNYTNQVMVFHSNSKPLFNLNLTSSTFLAGIQPEYSLSERVKIALETSIGYQTQAQILPTASQILAHDGLDNWFIFVTPQLQWNPVAKLSLEIYDTQPWQLINNWVSNNFVTQGVSSQSIINYSIQPPSIIGVKIGWLF